MFNIIKQCDYKNLDKKLDFLEHKLIEMTKCPEDKTKVLRDCLKSFKHHYKLKWTSASYKECRFRKTNEQWLKKKILCLFGDTINPADLLRNSKNVVKEAKGAKRRT